MPPFDISSVVLCDDVRQENNGKHILIGVYLHTVLVSDFPTNLALSVWVEINPKEVGEFSGKIRIIEDENSVLLRGETHVVIKNPEPTTVQFLRMPLEFQRGGDYLFQWKFGDDEWQTVKEFEVRKRPTIM
jgi:hypothetical protein